MPFYAKWQTKLQYNEGKCDVCTALEDEFQFALKCPPYYEFRIHVI